MTAVVINAVFPSGQDRFDQFRSCLPMKVARARRGFGGYISFDFGDQQDQDKVTNEPQFEWHLWIYMCDWDLHKGKSRMLWRRESDNALAGSVLEMLEGESLKAVDYDQADDCFVFRFSGGFTLNIDPDFYDYDMEDDLFMLFKNGDRDALNYSPRRRFYRAA